jgi:hypothetical protein
VIQRAEAVRDNYNDWKRELTREIADKIVAIDRHTPATHALNDHALV